MPEVRPLVPADAEAVYPVQLEAFAELDRRLGFGDAAPPADPEPGLRPDRQSSGLGSELLRRAVAYGAGTRGGMILATLAAGSRGRRRGRALRPRRVARRRPPNWLAGGNELLVHEACGYAVHDGSQLRVLAVHGPEAAADLLRAALHRTAEGAEVHVDFLDALQDWAVDVVLEAGPELRGSGATFVRGDVGRCARTSPAAPTSKKVTRPSPSCSVRHMPKQPRSLAGKVVVVTGGGRGIGAATARALVARGARVAIGDVDLETAQRTAADIGGGTVARYLDVTDRPGFTAFLDEVEGSLGPIDVLVNNAGIMPLAPVEEETDATVIRQLELNLHAVIHGSKEAILRMKPRRTGHIVNVASVAGKAGFPGGATYCAVKHGVVGFSEAIRLELRGTGIEVSCVMPSLVATELASGVEDSPFVKRAKPEDVAEAIVAALRKPRFDVYVPRISGYISQAMAPMPRAFREATARLLKADRLLIDAARGHGRAAYEARAAASTPAAEAVVEEQAAERAAA